MSEKTVEHGTHAVLYTDGGYKRSIGLGGWGVHGFTYDQTETKRGSGCKNAVITEKGYMGKDHKEVKPLNVRSYINGFGAIHDQATNNVAELEGLKQALTWVERQPLESVLLKLDSQYVLEGFKKSLDHWSRNGWTKADGSAIANQSHWLELKDLKDAIAAKNIKLNYQWVKGHAGHFGNEQADQHATRAMISAASGAGARYWNEADAAGYWKPATERSRLINQPQWYFPTISESPKKADGSTVYYLGHSGKKAKPESSPVNDLGKETSETRMSVLYLKEPDPVLEQVRACAVEMAAGLYRGLMVGDLTAMTKRRYDEISTYGISSLIRDYGRMRIMYDPNEMVCEEITPARLVYRAIDTLNHLEETLDHFLEHGDNPKSNIAATEITDILYEEQKSKKSKSFALRKNINVSLRSIDVECMYSVKGTKRSKTTLRLNLGQDLPDRNTLAAIAGKDTEVWLLTWPESPAAIRYASVVRTPEGVGIWAGPYSNLHLLKS